MHFKYSFMGIIECDLRPFFYNDFKLFYLNFGFSMATFDIKIFKLSQ